VLVLPLPGIRARRKLRQFLFADHDAAQVENLLHGGRGAVGHGRDERPGVAARAGLQAFDVVQVFDGDA
jgi:hypothetical protein